MHIHTESVGNPPPRVAFLHGLLGRGRNWHQIANALAADGFPGLLVDLPNHGASDWTEDFSYLTMADQVADELRSQLSGRRISLIGHSMGGKVAMLIALRHPELVHKLVVIDIAPDLSEGVSNFDPILAAIAGFDLSPVTSRADADARLRPLIPDDSVRALVLQNLRARPRWSWQSNIALLADSLDAIAAWPSVPETNYLGPVLWLNGSGSSYVQPEHDTTMYRLFPNTAHREIPDAGHWVHADQPKAVAEALLEFLR